MALTTYTSYAEIRAVLGVSAKELTDVTLALPLYEQVLLQDLDEVSATVAAAYTSVAAIDPGSRTTTQQKLYEITRSFAAYQVASNLLTALPLFAPRAVKDGRAELERQADPYADTKVGVAAMLSKLKTRLATIEAAYLGAPALAALPSYNLTTSTGLAVDPITGA